MHVPGFTFLFPAFRSWVGGPPCCPPQSYFSFCGARSSRAAAALHRHLRCQLSAPADWRNSGDVQLITVPPSHRVWTSPCGDGWTLTVCTSRLGSPGVIPPFQRGPTRWSRDVALLDASVFAGCRERPPPREEHLRGPSTQSSCHARVSPGVKRPLRCHLQPNCLHQQTWVEVC